MQHAFGIGGRRADKGGMADLGHRQALSFEERRVEGEDGQKMIEGLRQRPGAAGPGGPHLWAHVFDQQQLGIEPTQPLAYPSVNPQESIRTAASGFSRAARAAV